MLVCVLAACVLVWGHLSFIDEVVRVNLSFGDRFQYTASFSSANHTCCCDGAREFCCAVTGGGNDPHDPKACDVSLFPQCGADLLLLVDKCGTCGGNEVLRCFDCIH